MTATAGLRQAARRARLWTARRDLLIRQAHDDGLSLRAIGEVAGLSHTAIAKILAR